MDTCEGAVMIEWKPLQFIKRLPFWKREQPQMITEDMREIAEKYGKDNTVVRVARDGHTHVCKNGVWKEL